MTLLQHGHGIHFGHERIIGCGDAVTGPTATAAPERKLTSSMRAWSVLFS
jgi:hypothetical protein